MKTTRLRRCYLGPRGGEDTDQAGDPSNRDSYRQLRAAVQRVIYTRALAPNDNRADDPMQCDAIFGKGKKGGKGKSKDKGKRGKKGKDGECDLH